MVQRQVIQCHDVSVTHIWSPFNYYCRSPRQLDSEGRAPQGDCPNAEGQIEKVLVRQGINGRRGDILGHGWDPWRAKTACEPCSASRVNPCSDPHSPRHLITTINEQSQVHVLPKGRSTKTDNVSDVPAGASQETLVTANGIGFQGPYPGSLLDSYFF